LASNLLANDTDVEGDALTITGVGKPLNGTVSLVSGNPVFTPTTNFSGVGSFVYTASDGNGGTDSAAVTITVNPVNDAPAANPDTYTVLMDRTLEVAAPGVLANDTDVDGDARDLTAVLSKDGLPSHGELRLYEDGSFIYTPVRGYSGPDAFSYQAVDRDGARSKAALVNVNVIFRLLLNASEEPDRDFDARSALTNAELQGIVTEAVARWTETGILDSRDEEKLAKVSFQIADLSDLALGQATPELVLIDVNAAGYGWYVDATPADDLEFGLKMSELELLASGTSPAFGRIDLLTVVMHELGHVLGLEDLDPNAGSLMSGTLDASTRRLNESTTDSPKLVQMDSMAGGGVSSLLWGNKDNKSSWLEDFLVDLTGKKDNPFDPTDKIKISIPGNNGGGNKKKMH